MENKKQLPLVGYNNIAKIYIYIYIYYCLFIKTKGTYRQRIRTMKFSKVAKLEINGQNSTGFPTCVCVYVLATQLCQTL